MILVMTKEGCKENDGTEGLCWHGQHKARLDI